MSFTDRLSSLIDSKKSHLCIGLDVQPERFPKSVISSADPVIEFNTQIIKYTEDIAAAYKINLAFYEALGNEGYRLLEKTLSMIPDEVLSIADGKRGDIGTSSEMYAKALFTELDFDAVTVNPYMGHDSIEPFTRYPEKGVFVLVLTSNPGAMDFQKFNGGNGNPLYIEVATKLSGWNKNDNIGMVLGATHPEELKRAVESAPGLPCLIPGVGKQGGDPKELKKIFSNNRSNSFLVNSSRAIIYASNREDFAARAREEAKSLREVLN